MDHQKIGWTSAVLPLLLMCQNISVSFGNEQTRSINKEISKEILSLEQDESNDYLLYEKNEQNKQKEFYTFPPCDFSVQWLDTISNPHVCRTCSPSCLPEQFLIKSCTNVSDRVCSFCKAGQVWSIIDSLCYDCSCCTENQQIEVVCIAAGMSENESCMANQTDQCLVALKSGLNAGLIMTIVMVIFVLLTPAMVLWYYTHRPSNLIPTIHPDYRPRTKRGLRLKNNRSKKIEELNTELAAECSVERVTSEGEVQVSEEDFSAVSLETNIAAHDHSDKHISFAIKSTSDSDGCTDIENEELLSMNSKESTNIAAMDKTPSHS